MLPPALETIMAGKSMAYMYIVRVELWESGPGALRALKSSIGFRLISNQYLGLVLIKSR